MKSGPEPVILKTIFAPGTKIGIDVRTSRDPIPDVMLPWISCASGPTGLLSDGGRHSGSLQDRSDCFGVLRSCEREEDDDASGDGGGGGRLGAASQAANSSVRMPRAAR